MKTQVPLHTLRRMMMLTIVDSIVVSRRLAVKVVLGASDHANTVVVADGTIDADMDLPLDTDELVDPTIDEPLDVTIDELVDPDEVES